MVSQSSQYYLKNRREQQAQREQSCSSPLQITSCEGRDDEVLALLSVCPAVPCQIERPLWRYPPPRPPFHCCRSGPISQTPMCGTAESQPLENCHLRRGTGAVALLNFTVPAALSVAVVVVVTLFAAAAAAVVVVVSDNASHFICCT